MVGNHNGLTKRPVVWCFLFYLSREAEALLHSLLNGNAKEVDVEQQEQLENSQR